MKRLSLNTGLSYSIRGFSCVKGEPFEVEDGLAEQLLATGRFDEQPVIANPAEESDTDNADLLALAEEKNISLEGCSKHDEYVERINGALGLVDFSKLGLE